MATEGGRAEQAPWTDSPHWKAHPTFPRVKCRLLCPVPRMKKRVFWPPAVPLGQDKPRPDRHLERGGATTLASLKQAMKKLQDKQKLGL